MELQKKSHPALVILAAGTGSRYGGLKQLAPIGPGGETLLEYSAYDALRSRFSRIVLVIRAENEPAFRDRLEGGLARHAALSFVHQSLDDLPAGFERPQGRVKPWGTGHGLLAAEADIQGAFAVVNADDFYGAESYIALSKYLHNLERVSSLAMPMAMVGFDLSQTLTDAGPVSRALCRLDDDGFLDEIVEMRKVWKRNGRIVYSDPDGIERVLDGDEVVSMNMWGFTRDFFAFLNTRFHEFVAQTPELGDAEFLLPDVVQSLLVESGARVQVLRGAGKWCGVTFSDDEKRAADMIASLVSLGHYPQELWPR